MFGTRVLEQILSSQSLTIGRMIPFLHLSLCNTYTKLLCEFNILEKDQETFSLMLCVLLFKGSYNTLITMIQIKKQSLIARDCIYIFYPKIRSIFFDISYVYNYQFITLTHRVVFSCFATMAFMLSLIFTKKHIKKSRVT